MEVFELKLEGLSTIFYTALKKFDEGTTPYMLRIVTYPNNLADGYIKGNIGMGSMPA